MRRTCRVFSGERRANFIYIAYDASRTNQALLAQICILVRVIDSALKRRYYPGGHARLRFAST